MNWSLREVDVARLHFTLNLQVDEVGTLQLIMPSQIGQKDHVGLNVAMPDESVLKKKYVIIWPYKKIVWMKIAALVLPR